MEQMIGWSCLNWCNRDFSPIAPVPTIISARMNRLMAEVVPSRRDVPFPEIRDAFTQKRTWAIALVFFALLIFMVRWPSIFGVVWEFSLLCCFPAGFFVWAAVSSGVVHKPPMAKIVITVVILHCVLLAGTVYLWSRNPKSITGDFGFGFFVIESAAIWLLMRLARPRGEAPDLRK